MIFGTFGIFCIVRAGMLRLANTNVAVFGSSKSRTSLCSVWRCWSWLVMKWGSGCVPAWIFGTTYIYPDTAHVGPYKTHIPVPWSPHWTVYSWCVATATYRPHALWEWRPLSMLTLLSSFWTIHSSCSLAPAPTMMLSALVASSWILTFLDFTLYNDIFLAYFGLVIYSANVRTINK